MVKTNVLMLRQEDYSMTETGFPWKWWYQQQLLGKELLDHFFLEKKKRKRRTKWKYLNKKFTNDDFVFIQDSKPSHRGRKVQTFSRETLNSRFVKNVDWPRIPLIVILWTTSFGIRYNKKCLNAIIVNLFWVYKS